MCMYMRRNKFSDELANYFNFKMWNFKIKLAHKLLNSQQFSILHF